MTMRVKEGLALRTKLFSRSLSGLAEIMRPLHQDTSEGWASNTKVCQQLFTEGLPVRRKGFMEQGASKRQQLKHMLNHMKHMFQGEKLKER